MAYYVNRRDFLKGAAVGAGVLVLTGAFRTNAYAANAKLNVAMIGVGGRAENGCDSASKENLVAMCDADSSRMAGFAGKQPQAKTYTDWRKIFDNHKDLNMVFVATPDHTHFPAAYSAVIRGAACYCEKPLTHSIWEARTLAEATKKMKVATQMGNQGHSGQGIRRVVEWVRAGVIGEVKEVHTWTNRPVWPQGKLGPFKTGTPPANFDWNAWLGVAPKKEYFVDNGGKSPVHPFAWRGWFDYGCGAIGDMGCHTWDNVWWSMDPKAPLSAEPVKIIDLGTDTYPKQMIVKWEFGPSEDGKRPAFTAYWYEGGLKPEVPDELKNDPDRPAGAGGRKGGGGGNLPGAGNLFIGTKGKILVEGDYSDSPRLIPTARMNEFKANEMQKIEKIPSARGHREQLVLAARGQEAWDYPGSNFTYAGPLVEAMNLANIAVRLGKKVTWDPKNMKCPGTPEADILIKRPYRKEFWDI